jgi:Chitin binding Peritrophin-A domain
MICDPSAECNVITCSLDGPIHIAYAVNSPYYVWCSMDLTLGIRFPILMECPANLVFDETISSCNEPTTTPATTTQAPVITTTQEPVITTTQEPVITTTQAPVITTTQAPVITTTQAPVITTTQAPVITTTQAPVITTTQAPVITTTQAPVITTTQEPVITTTLAPTTTAPPTDFICTYEEYLPDPRDCTVFQDCTQLVAVRRQCAAGSFYNAEQRLCLLASMTTCIEVDCDNSDGIILSYGGLSQYYVYCSKNLDGSNTPLVIKCPDGRVYDEEIMECVLPGPVITTTQAPVITTTQEPVITTTLAPVITTTQAPVITTSQAPVLTTTQAPVTTTTQAPEITTTLAPTTTEPPTDFICTYEEYLPDPRDCTVFQDCTSSVAVRRQCAAGSLYNAEQRLCMLASMTTCIEVDCDSSGGVFLSYGGLSQYYVYCSVNLDGSKTPLVIKCLDGRVYDENTMQCVLSG